MSEYQYYEFQAIDRCLTEREMNELRHFSSRAEITSYSFINEYSWGSFKGDEDLLMEKYFDGFLYYANWGTHILKLRLPLALLDLNTVQSYCNDDQFSVRQTDDKLILDFVSQNENGGEWEEDLRLAPFLSLRTDLIRGDRRCLYLGWLSGLQNDEYDDEEFEPSVPPGLQNLNPALSQLADFLRIDFDLINAAAQMSPSLEDVTPNVQDLQKWVCTLSQHEKDCILKEILEGSLKGDQTIALQQICHFSRAWQSFQEGKNEKPKKRTVGQLLRESENVRQTRIQFSAKKAAAELAEQQRLQGIAREKRLNEIMGREEKIWNQIEVLASEKKAKSYDQAIDLLVDLRDLAQREKSTDFSGKFDDLKRRHSSKLAFIQRLKNVSVSR
jgi:hypothetical protein